MSGKETVKATEGSGTHGPANLEKREETDVGDDASKYSYSYYSPTEPEDEPETAPPNKNETHNGYYFPGYCFPEGKGTQNGCGFPF